MTVLYPRRKFLAQSLCLAGLSALPSFARSDDDVEGNLGIALVGLGGYSRNQLAPALQMTRHCHLSGVVTGSPEKIPEWKRKYQLKDANIYSYKTMGEMANNPAIQVVYIVVPTGLHAKYAIRAAEAVKHVWCEKPMAMTVKECRSIIDACERNGVKLSIGYRMHHEPNTRKVMEFARSKPYGEIRDLEAAAGYAGPGKGNSWRFNPELGGGALYDMGVYPINALRYATGLEPIRVLSAKCTYSPKGVNLTTEFELEFPGGLRGKGKTSVVESYNFLRVNCEKGWYELRPMSTYNGVKGRTSDGTLLNEKVESQQALQMEADALAILKDKPVRVPGKEGLRDIRIVHAIMESDRTGGAVEI